MDGCNLAADLKPNLRQNLRLDGAYAEDAHLDVAFNNGDAHRYLAHHARIVSAADRHRDDGGADGDFGVTSHPPARRKGQVERPNRL